MEDSYSLMPSVDMYLYRESYGCIFGDRAERLSAYHPITNTAPIQRQGRQDISQEICQGRGRTLDTKD